MLRYLGGCFLYVPNFVLATSFQCVLENAIYLVLFLCIAAVLY